MANIDTEKIGLYLPQIDSRDEEQLYQQALNVVANRSQGQLNDFSDSNPLGTLLRAQAFTSAEVLYKVNQLPLALAIKFLELTGVERKLGQKSQASLTFYLTAPRNTPFVVPAGFQVVGGDLSFFTERVLTIPAGASSGVVDAAAEKVGVEYNLPAYTLNQLTQPLAFLASVINTAPSQGGSSAESVEETIARGLTALRSRNPVSAVDFEASAQDTMGSGSRAKAIGLLAPDKVTIQPGAVHLFLLSATGEPANFALVNDVYAALQPRIMLGTSLYVSPMELAPISATVTAKLLPGQDPNTVASDLWAAYKSYLAPQAYTPGQTLLIDEVRHQLRFVNGIELIDELKLNDGYQNIPMANEFTLPSAYSLRIYLTDEKSNLFDIGRGNLESPDFGEPI